MPNEVITVTDRQIVIKTGDKAETFSMVEIPPVGSKLVEAARARVLVNLELETLIRDLSRTGQLLFLAYCGVAGFGPLRKALTEMQDKLAVLCGDCELALNGFAEASQQVLNTLKEVFGHLLAGKEDWALEELATCGETAMAMEAEAASLAERFNALGDSAIKTLGDTTIQKGLSEDSQRKLDAQLGEIKVSKARGDALREALATSREEMEVLYNEAKEKAEKEDDRAFAVALTGAILGSISSAVGAYTSIYKKGDVDVPPPAPAPEPAADTAKKSAATEKLEKEEKERKEKAAAEETEKAAVNEATENGKAAKAAAEIKAKEDAARTAEEKAKVDEAKAAEATRAAAAAEAETRRKVEARAEEEKKATAAGAAIAAAGAETAKQMSEMAKDRAKAAASYNDQKMEFLKQKMAIQAEERKNLVNLAGYAVQMTQVADARAIEARTTESLFQAVGALKSIAAILRTNAKFWKQMAAACKRLGGSDTDGLKAKIKRFKNEPDRLKYYVEDKFKTQVVNYYASWRALQSVSAEYCMVAAKVGNEVLDDFKKNPTNDESRQWAVNIGAKLRDSAQAQIGQNERITAALQETLTETSAAKAKAA